MSSRDIEQLSAVIKEKKEILHRTEALAKYNRVEMTRLLSTHPRRYAEHIAKSSSYDYCK
jgi:hypothetical protein